MSRIALQRVMVRMLYDAEFAERVLRDPASALDGEPGRGETRSGGTPPDVSEAEEASAIDVSAGDRLTEEEQRWLLRPDPRAWRADPERPLRSLGVLLQEYPAACALAVAAGGGAGVLRGFFSSGWFHRVIRKRGSMALAFGDYLVEQAETRVVPDGRVPPLARLEQAIARLRRGSGRERSVASSGTAPAAVPMDAADSTSSASPSSAPPSSTPPSSAPRTVASRSMEPGSPKFRLSPDKALHTAEAGTGDLNDAIHSLLAGSNRELARAVLEPEGPMPPLPTDPDRPEPLLLELIQDGSPRLKCPVGVAEISPELYAVLEFAAIPRARAELEAEALGLGADPDDAFEIIDGLIEEEVLVEAGIQPRRG